MSLQTVPKPSTVADEADELGELDRQVQLFAPIAARHEVLKKRFESRAKEEPADKPVIYRGKIYEVQFGPRRNERTIVNRKRVFNLLKKVLGLDGVLALLDIPLGAVDKNVPKSEQEGLVVEERTGWRSLSTVALNAAGNATLPPAA